MRTKLYAGVAFAALMLPASAFAQSTGSIDFEKEAEIVVTGSKADKGVNGIVVPNTSKAKAQLGNEHLSRETPGQSVLDSINMLPGVSFSNNDPYGSAGGALVIRGFDASRIALTIDGVPLNDTGNYAIYSNQQLDPELIERANVILGSTDIDSPTASASGSTVNYTSLNPTDAFGVRLVGSVGDLNMMRVFGVVNTGTFTPWGTKSWFAMSNQNYNTVYTNRGKIRKSQYNFKIYQPIGSNGDFIAIAGNYNVNRNNNTPGYKISGAPTTKSGRAYNIPYCTISAGTPGKEDAATPCGSSFIENFNPSNTGTLRITSSFHLADDLVLSVEPTYWYVKANGGLGAAVVSEQAGTNGLVGYVQGGPKKEPGYYFGRDLNGDGDLLDQVRLYAPSQTRTNRYMVISSLRWSPSDTQSLRLSYTHDYGRHRQTGEFTTLNANGSASRYFPLDNPLTASNGSIYQKRNRKSFAILDAISAEYRGKFFDGHLIINAGISGKFFKRDLTNYCFTTSSSGNISCVAGDANAAATYAAENPYSYDSKTGKVTGYAPPQSRNFKYSRIIPSGGLIYKLNDNASLYASYSQGLQVPGTDNLYQSFYTPVGVRKPKPELTHNFDGGFRYVSSTFQAQFGPWMTIFTNRLASAYDPELDVTIYRNLGVVHRYGVDGQIDYRPIREITMHAFASYLKSRILSNVQTGANTYAMTAGKRESGAPVYTLGARADVNLDPVTFGVEVKRTGRSYYNDQNLDLIVKGVNYGKYTRGYTVVNLDARVNLDWAGLNKTTYVQFNVTNLFDKMYTGNFSSSLNQANDPNINLGAPRTFTASLNVQF